MLETEIKAFIGIFSSVNQVDRLIINRKTEWNNFLEKTEYDKIDELLTIAVAWVLLGAPDDVDQIIISYESDLESIKATIKEALPNITQSISEGFKRLNRPDIQ